MKTSQLFALRYILSTGTLIIQAFDAYETDPVTGHKRIDVRVILKDKVLFERGELYCAVNRWTALDSDAAKELVISLVAMKPGDTDPEYFDSYSNDQLEFATSNGDYLSMMAEDRIFYNV